MSTNYSQAFKPAVVLLSGGLDSTVCLAKAIHDGFAVHALTFDYGQRHRVEIEAAAKQAALLGAVEHRVFRLDLSQFGGSSLLGDGVVPKNTPEHAIGATIPTTYVPARNTIFLSIALGWAEVLGARDLFIGVSSVDYSGYPDCRPEFIAAFEAVANRGTRAAETGPPYTIHTPLVGLNKAETVQLGTRLGVDFSWTHTCYDPKDGRPCGACESCLLRARGFAQAGLPDPALEGKRA